MGVRIIPFGSVGNLVRGELGGVQILLIDDELGSKIMIDIGQRPDHTNDYYGFPYKTVRYRALDISNYIGSFPNLDDFYRADYEERRGRKLGKLPIDGILITHEHIDHFGGLPLVRPDMPVAMNELSMLQLYIWDRLGSNEFLSMYDRFSLGMNATGGEKFLQGDEARIDRNIQRFRPGEPFKLGNFNFMAYRVDHSVPGACAFIVETSIGKIAISGDFRSRGRKGEATEKFVQACIDQKVKYFMIEGSLLHFPHHGTESDVTRELTTLGKKSSALFYSAPPRDFDRTTSVFDAAKALKRIQVLPMDQALYLKAYDGIDGYPTLNQKNLAVLIPKLRKGLLNDPRYSIDMVLEDYRYWQRPFVEKYEKYQQKPPKHPSIQLVTVDDIKAHPENFLVYLPGNPSVMLDMFESIRPPSGSRYIRMHPAAYTPSMEVTEGQKRNVLQDFGMNYGPKADYFEPSTMRDMDQIHVAGHHNDEETGSIINRVHESRVAPDETIFIPYHTLYLENFKRVAPNAKFLIPQAGMPLELK